MPLMVEVKCKQCKKPFNARVADRKRGWGKFCSKSCKAIKQESTTGQYKKYKSDYAGSGVSKEKFEHYQDKHGGIPTFDKNGNFEGFLAGRFDDDMA